jgi:hypothetical protein
MVLQPGTNRQIPDHSIMDYFRKQTYLSNQYVYTAASSLTGTSEVPLYLLSNPAVMTSSFPANYVSLFQNFSKLICATGSEDIILRYYLNPTVSAAGTPVTPVNLRPESSNTPKAVLTSGPTISANGSLIKVLASGSFLPDESDILSILDPANSILITVQPSGTCSGIVVTGWFEL